MDSDELKKKKARYAELNKKQEAVYAGDKTQKMSDAEVNELSKLESQRQSSNKQKDGFLSSVKKKLVGMFSKKRKKKTATVATRKGYTPQRDMSPSEYKENLKKLKREGKNKPIYGN